MDFFQDIEKGSNSTTIKIKPLLPGVFFKIVFDIGIYDIGKYPVGWHHFLLVRPFCEDCYGIPQKAKDFGLWAFSRPQGQKSQKVK